MSAATADIALLRARAGRYAGHGIDDQDRPFHGELEVAVVLEHGVRLRYRATGIDGTCYLFEHGWVGVDGAGRGGLWTLSTAHPEVRHHVRRYGAPAAGAETTLVFASAAPDGPDPSPSRRPEVAEIAIDLWSDGDLSYRRTAASYRSAVRLRPEDPAGPSSGSS